MRTRGKIDANQSAIVKALRQIPNVSVQSLAPIGDGCPDLLIGVRSWVGTTAIEINWLVEVKDGQAAGLTDDQTLWHARWQGQVAVCRTVDEVCALIGAEVKR